MIDLRSLAAALDGKRQGSTYRCRCPVHGGHSLIACERTGKILVNCRHGCDQTEVIGALKARGLWQRATTHYAPAIQTYPQQSDDEKRRRALALFDEAGSSKLCERYLRGRGIVMPAPRVLRLGRQLWHPQSHTNADAIVALVEHEVDGPVGCHLTFLDATDERKADLEPNKKMRGKIAGGAVRLAEPEPGEWLVLGTGIETTMAAMQIKGLPGWAVLSDIGLRTLILPTNYRKILIAGDNDSTGAGQKAAYEAADRFRADGRLVRVAIPRWPDTDWNDVLLEKPEK